MNFGNLGWQLAQNLSRRLILRHGNSLNRFELGTLGVAAQRAVCCAVDAFVLAVFEEALTGVVVSILLSLCSHGLSQLLTSCTADEAACYQQGVLNGARCDSLRLGSLRA